MATKYIVNNVTGQTINGESILPKYKVYTALLTQSGGDNELSLLSGNTLTIGVTYSIGGYGAGDDFSNVGGPPPSNDTDFWSGYRFCATGTTPAIWTNTYLDYNTGAPVASVLEDNIGKVYFKYESTGVYTVGNTDSFFFSPGWNDTKLWYSCGGIGNSGDITDGSGKLYFSFENNNLLIVTYDNTNTLINGNLFNTPIEIRVYN